MAIDDPVEWFKLLGSIGGIASSGFLIYDRIWRLRPIVYLRPYDFHVYLRIKNTADEALIIDRIAVSPRVLSIAMNDGENAALLSIVEAITAGEGGSRAFLVLGPQEERSFRLIGLPAFKDLKDNERVRIRCDWRSTRKPWPFTRSVTVTTNRSDFGAFLKAAREPVVSPKIAGCRRGIGWN
jgi:hypothetical protein